MDDVGVLLVVDAKVVDALVGVVVVVGSVVVVWTVVVVGFIVVVVDLTVLVRLEDTVDVVRFVVDVQYSLSLPSLSQSLNVVVVGVVVFDVDVVRVVVPFEVYAEVEEVDAVVDVVDVQWL